MQGSQSNLSKTTLMARLLFLHPATASSVATTEQGEENDPRLSIDFLLNPSSDQELQEQQQLHVAKKEPNAQQALSPEEWRIIAALHQMHEAQKKSKRSSMGCGSRQPKRNLKRWTFHNLSICDNGLVMDEIQRPYC